MIDELCRHFYRVDEFLNNWRKALPFDRLAAEFGGNGADASFCRELSDEEFKSGASQVDRISVELCLQNLAGLIPVFSSRIEAVRNAGHRFIESCCIHQIPSEFAFWQDIGPEKLVSEERFLRHGNELSDVGATAVEVGIALSDVSSLFEAIDRSLRSAPKHTADHLKRSVPYQNRYRPGPCPKCGAPLRVQRKSQYMRYLHCNKCGYSCKRPI